MSSSNRGRQLVLWLSAGLLAPQLLVALVAIVLRNNALIGQAVTRLLIAAIMCALMIRGYSWARSYLAGVSILGGVVTLLAGLASMTVLSIIIAVIFGAPFLIVGIVLWRSDAIDAYIEDRTARRDPTLGLDLNRDV